MMNYKSRNPFYMFSCLRITIFVNTLELYHIVITLKDATTRMEDPDLFGDPFTVFSVFSVFKRYHTRYHSNIASFLYLVDLHVCFEFSLHVDWSNYSNCHSYRNGLTSYWRYDYFEWCTTSTFDPTETNHSNGSCTMFDFGLSVGSCSQRNAWKDEDGCKEDQEIITSIIS